MLKIINSLYLRLFFTHDKRNAFLTWIPLFHFFYPRFRPRTIKQKIGHDFDETGRFNEFFRSCALHVFLFRIDYLRTPTPWYRQYREIAKRHHASSSSRQNNSWDLEHSIQLYNQNLGLEYLTGYVVEYALSVDNIFVMVLIFTAFGVAQKNYHRVLFWGILGAIIMRFIFIFVGAALIEKFSWIMYVFGAFLVFTGIKMFIDKDSDEEIDTQNHPIVKFANRFFKVHNHFVGNKFFVTIDGIKKVTPLFLVLLIIEATDLIFAVDSIPAIFSVTKDPYIVFFSNIFAIIGLRSMFFLLAGIIDKFRFLKIGLAVLLTFIGLKMLFHHYLEGWGFSTTHSLLIIVGILGASIFFSLIFPEHKKERKLKYDPENEEDLHR